MRFASKIALLASIVATVGLAACSGGGDGDASMDADASNNPYSFEAVSAILTSPTCTASATCHQGGLGAGGMLHFDTPAHAYAAIVGVRSTELTTMNIVEPGDSTRSFLYQKVSRTMTQLYMIPGCDNATQSCGVTMPMVAGPSPFLTTAQLETIRGWIASGAPMSGQMGTFDGGR
jgi:hypothetical protein